MTVHNLKIMSPFFVAIRDGTKTWEVRVDDRDFKVGDVLHLMEYEFISKRYTGRTVDVNVTYICQLPQSDELVGMSIEVLP